MQSSFLKVENTHTLSSCLLVSFFCALLRKRGIEWPGLVSGFLQFCLKLKQTDQREQQRMPGQSDWQNYCHVWLSIWVSTFSVSVFVCVCVVEGGSYYGVKSIEGERQIMSELLVSQPAVTFLC